MSHAGKWIETLDDAQVRDVHALMRGEWWCADRSLVEVEQVIAGSDLVLAYLDSDGAVAAFLRVLSDGIFKAMLFDVIVRPDHRDSGLGRMLVERAVEHKKLALVKSLELYCPDRISGFYKNLGFTVSDSRLHCLRRVDSNSPITKA